MRKCAAVARVCVDDHGFRDDEVPRRTGTRVEVSRPLLARPFNTLTMPRMSPATEPCDDARPEPSRFSGTRKAAYTRTMSRWSGDATRIDRPVCPITSMKPSSASPKVLTSSSASTKRSAGSWLSGLRSPMGVVCRLGTSPNDAGWVLAQVRLLCGGAAQSLPHTRARSHGAL